MKRSGYCKPRERTRLEAAMQLELCTHLEPFPTFPKLPRLKECLAHLHHPITAAATPVAKAPLSLRHGKNLTGSAPSQATQICLATERASTPSSRSPCPARLPSRIETTIRSWSALVPIFPRAAGDSDSWRWLATSQAGLRLVFPCQVPTAKPVPSSALRARRPGLLSRLGAGFKLIAA